MTRSPCKCQTLWFRLWFSSRLLSFNHCRKLPPPPPLPPPLPPQGVILWMDEVNFAPAEKPWLMIRFPRKCHGFNSPCPPPCPPPPPSSPPPPPPPSPPPHRKLLGFGLGRRRASAREVPGGAGGAPCAGGPRPCGGHRSRGAGRFGGGGGRWLGGFSG